MNLYGLHATPSALYGWNELHTARVFDAHVSGDTVTTLMRSGVPISDENTPAVDYPDLKIWYDKNGEPGRMSGPCAQMSNNGGEVTWEQYSCGGYAMATVATVDISRTATSWSINIYPHVTTGASGGKLVRIALAAHDYVKYYNDGAAISKAEAYKIADNLEHNL